jgi:polar amino acid transport system permease protein
VTLLLENFFNLAVLAETYPYLLRGFFVMLQLCLIVIPVGIMAGLVVAVLGSFGIPWLRWLLVVYVDLFRSLPPLVLLIFVYQGLPMVGVDISGLGAVVLSFLLNTSAYYGEILRAGIESIPKGQQEAARSTGMTRLGSMVYVVLPQAVRNVVPDLISNTLEVVKLTSIASVVALPELLRMARLAQGATYNPTPLIAAAAIYLAVCWPIVRLLSRFERKMIARM